MDTRQYRLLLLRSSIQHASYIIQDIQIDQQMEATLNHDQKLEIVQSCPTKVYDINAKTGNIDIVNSNACIFCEECVRKVETFKIPRMIKLATKPNKYIFYVESTGQLKASDIVQKVIDLH